MGGICTGSFKSRGRVGTPVHFMSLCLVPGVRWLRRSFWPSAEVRFELVFWIVLVSDEIIRRIKRIMGVIRRFTVEIKRLSTGFRDFSPEIERITNTFPFLFAVTHTFTLSRTLLES
jgi:hypothetical protein